MSAPATAPEIVPLPKTPDLSYLFELGRTHVWGDGLLSGSSTALAMASELAVLPNDIAERLRLTSWHMGGHLGAVGDAVNSMNRPYTPPVAERVTAVRRAAVALSTVTVAEAVLNEPNPDLTGQIALSFFRNVGRALVNGDVPKSITDGPARQQAAYRYAYFAGRRLGFGDSDQGDRLALVGDLVEEIGLDRLIRMEESGRARPNPDKLLESAGRAGELMTGLAAAVVLPQDEGLHPAMAAVGAIGGIQEHNSPTVTAKGLHTFASALVLAHGPIKGPHIAKGVGIGYQTALYNHALAGTQTRRQRGIVRTVTSFITNPRSHP